MEAEYLRRGGEHFRQVVALGDGAAWIWTMAGPSTPTPPTSWTSTTPASTWTTWRTTWPSSPPTRRGGRRPHAELDAGNISAIIDAARQYPLEGVKASELDKKLGYFEHNAHRMRYADFRKLGMFTGSGDIEGGIKAIVVQRAKQSGMHWTSRAPKTSSACAASTPAAGGMTSPRRATRRRAPRSHLTDTATQNRRLAA